MHSSLIDLWEPCPSGTLQNLASRLRANRRRAQAVRLSLVTSLVFGTGVVLWSTYSKPVEYDFGGIVCSEVRQISKDYLGGHLALELTHKIDAHLLECPNCKPLMDAMRNELSLSAKRLRSSGSAPVELASNRAAKNHKLLSNLAIVEESRFQESESAHSISAIAKYR